MQANRVEKLLLRKDGLKSIILGIGILARLDNEYLLSEDGLDDERLEDAVRKETQVFQDQVDMIDTVICNFGLQEVDE